jgi:hypothetical protein
MLTAFVSAMQFSPFRANIDCQCECSMGFNLRQEGLPRFRHKFYHYSKHGSTHKVAGLPSYHLVHDEHRHRLLYNKFYDQNVNP